MKVYGYDINGAVQGELYCNEIDTFDRDCVGMEGVAQHFEWEAAFTNLKDAKKALAAEMVAEQTDPELISFVRSLTMRDLV